MKMDGCRALNCASTAFAIHVSIRETGSPQLELEKERLAVRPRRTFLLLGQRDGVQSRSSASDTGSGWREPLPNISIR
jgi:hypothetical protein